MRKRKKNKIELGPVFTIMLMSFILMLVSVIFSITGIGAHQTNIVGDTLETSLITVKNIFSVDGIKFLFGDMVNNFALFEPLALTIISLIGIGIAEKSGLFKALFINLKNFRPRTITFFTLFVAIILNFFGNNAFVIVIPMAGIVYKYANRNSRLGIITAFIGTAIGMGAGIIFNNTDLLLGVLTQASASLEVDKNYIFSLNSSLYIMMFSALLISLIGSIIIDSSLTKYFPKKTPLQDEDLKVSKKGIKLSLIISLFLLILIVYMIVPGLPGSGVLLDSNGTNYLEKLMGSDSVFKDSIMYLFTLMLMISSLVYGYVSGNIKSSNDYSVGLSKGFEGIGYLFVLLFFTSQMISILDWTNLGMVISLFFINSFTATSLSGIFLIIAFFLVVVLVSLFVPATLYKWQLLSPTVVPMFMKANMTPDFAQFIFRAADGVGSALTPVFPYFVVAISFLQKYNYDEENKITVFGVLKKILVPIILLIILWLLILIGWYIIGLPMGPETFTTLN